MDFYWVYWIGAAFLFWIWLELIRGEAPLVPLPGSTVRSILKLARLKKGETVYDLGSGDGRVLIIAANEFKAKGIGIERNPFLVFLSREMARRRCKMNSVEIIKNDLFKENIEDADVVVIYLSHKLTQKLKNKFKKELKKGTRIVSASHKIEGWKEARKIKTGHFYSYLYKI